MNANRKLPFEFGNAICYSGFREEQYPGGPIPSYEQVKEDLLLLQGDWKYLRVYDCDPHGAMILEVIRQEKLDFKVMQGAYIAAEVNNPNCPWDCGEYPDEQLAANKIQNDERIKKLIELANAYPDIINCLSVGNEATVDWTDHLVPVERVIDFVKQTKAQTTQPVTFCENYVPWLGKLKPLVEEIDFISIHTYPVWEYKPIEQGMPYTQENYYAVANMYPDKAVVITEAGWTTNSNNRGIPPHHVNEEIQKVYLDALMEWTTSEQIITYVFEAFDEPWKGSPDPMEPEKHWGLYRVDRTPKIVAQDLVTL